MTLPVICWAVLLSPPMRVNEPLSRRTAWPPSFAASLTSRLRADSMSPRADTIATTTYGRAGSCAINRIDWGVVCGRTDGSSSRMSALAHAKAPSRAARERRRIWSIDPASLVCTCIRGRREGCSRALCLRCVCAQLIHRPARCEARIPPSLSNARWPDSAYRRREVAVLPVLQVIVSNVTASGFRLDSGFPARLTDVLRARFERLPDGPTLFVIPTELIPDNGRQLAAMVDEVAREGPQSGEFRAWRSARVRFCSSLVDRITPGAPPPDQRAALEAG